MAKKYADELIRGKEGNGGRCYVSTQRKAIVIPRNIAPGGTPYRTEQVILEVGPRPHSRTLVNCGCTRAHDNLHSKWGTNQLRLRLKKFDSLAEV